MPMLRKPHSGFTLMELIIGLGVGVFILGGAVLIYTTLMNSFYSLIATNRLQSQLSNAISIMSTNIRRAGYDGQATARLGTGTNGNPFMASATDIQTPSSNCILFTYDANYNGTLSALNNVNADERFGYRLSNGAIQARSPTDSSFSCSAGTWDNLTDPTLITVNTLTFNITPTSITLNTAGNTLTIRVVTITITAQLVKYPSVTITMTQTIRVRNDKFQT